MIISIASGKGGTGKTTLSTNLALAWGDKIRLMDCDVEEPNAHLFLEPELDRREHASIAVPWIDIEKCTFCKKCMDICRFGALAVLKNEVLVFQELCHSCGGCFEVCPENAVIEKQKTIGEIESGTAGSVSFVHGRLDVGQVMVPPLIKEVREHTGPEQVTIIDAPPGTSCPVIAGMNHTDFVLLVTEPTPFGLHDLKLAVEVVRILGIPHGLVINRAGIGNDEVKEYARKEKLQVLMEIPFDRKIAEAYSNGQMIVDAIPEYRHKFRTLLEKIINIVEGRGQN